MVQLLEILKQKYGIKRLMVEGGAKVIESFKDISDLRVVSISPTILHGEGVNIKIDIPADAQKFPEGKDTMHIWTTLK